MAQVLTLTRNPNTNQIVAAKIDSLIIEDLRGIMQNLQTGALQATITANFTEVTVIEGTVGPIPAPPMVITFAPGVTTGTTVATISEGLPSGASFKYALKTSKVPTPMVGDNATTALGTLTTYVQGSPITADPGMVVAMAIVDAGDGILKLTQHTLTVAEVAS